MLAGRPGADGVDRRLQVRGVVALDRSDRGHGRDVGQVHPAAAVAGVAEVWELVPGPVGAIAQPTVRRLPGPVSTASVPRRRPVRLP